MANIFDYLKWRADIPFSLDPFNVVDNLVLAELSYSRFADIIGPGESMTIEEASTRYFEVHSEEEIEDDSSYTRYAPVLLKHMANNERFGGTVIFNVMDELDPENTEQMAANAFKLPDGTIYIAYRGTDGTVTGWKEDCLLCYMSGTTGQKKAIDYLNNNFNNCDNLLRVGGHSKGGNFAVYAAAHANQNIFDRIINVYSNDGPGFLPDDVIVTEGYKKIVPKVISIIPHESIIGMLLENEYKDVHIVRSTAKGMVQHDAFTWRVLRNEFEQENEISDTSIFVKSVINGWLNDVSEEERAMFVTSLFSFFEVTGSEKIDEIGDEKLKNASAMYKNLKNMPEEERKLFFKNLGKFAEKAGDNMIDNMMSSATDFFHKVIKSGTKEGNDEINADEDDLIEEKVMEEFHQAMMEAKTNVSGETEDVTEEKKSPVKLIRKAFSKRKVEQKNENDENAGIEYTAEDIPEEMQNMNEKAVTEKTVRDEQEDKKKTRLKVINKAVSKVKDRKAKDEEVETEDADKKE